MASPPFSMSWSTSLECCLDSSEVSRACQIQSLTRKRSERRTGVVEVSLVASDDVSWVGRHVDVCGERVLWRVTESVLLKFEKCLNDGYEVRNPGALIHIQLYRHSVSPIPPRTQCTISYDRRPCYGVCYVNDRVSACLDRPEVSRSLVSLRYPLPRRLESLGSRHAVAVTSRLR